MLGRTNAVVINGASDFGHTVDFISDGLPYAKYIVTDGQSVPQPPTDPTKSGLHFGGWLDDGTAVTFPYTPDRDITFTAEFALLRDGMVLTEANKTICTFSDRGYYKTNSGWAIAGYTYDGSKTSAVLVALSSDAAGVTAGGLGPIGIGGSFVYHDITYYYPRPGYTSGDRISTSTDVVDLYKCTDSTMEAAALTLVKRYLYEI